VEAKEHGIRRIMISGHPDTMDRSKDRADQLSSRPFGREALKRAVAYALASDVPGQRKEDPGG
jgi:hypothetical protein